jgi:hypothetical protein
LCRGQPSLSVQDPSWKGKQTAFFIKTLESLPFGPGVAPPGRSCTPNIVQLNAVKTKGFYCQDVPLVVIFLSSHLHMIECADIVYYHFA